MAARDSSLSNVRAEEANKKTTRGRRSRRVDSDEDRVMAGERRGRGRHLGRRRSLACGDAHDEDSGSNVFGNQGSACLRARRKHREEKSNVARDEEADEALSRISEDPSVLTSRRRSVERDEKKATRSSKDPRGSHYKINPDKVDMQRGRGFVSLDDFLTTEPSSLALTSQNEMYDTMTALSKQLARLDASRLRSSSSSAKETESIMHKAALILMASAEHSRQLQEDKRCKDAKIRELMNSIKGLEKNYCARIQSLTKTIVQLRDDNAKLAKDKVTQKSTRPGEGNDEEGRSMEKFSLEKRVDDIGQGDALRIGGEVKARPERRPKRLEDTVISEVEERTADNKPGQILETSCVGVEHNQDEEEKVRRLRNRQQELDESLEDPRRCATYIVYSAEDLATDSTLHADTQQAALKREKEQVTLTKDASRATHDHEATEESDHWKPPHLRLKNGHRAQLGEDSPGAADGQGFDVAVNMMNSSEDAESKGIMRKSRRLRSCRQDTPELMSPPEPKESLRSQQTSSKSPKTAAPPTLVLPPEKKSSNHDISTTLVKNSSNGLASVEDDEIKRSSKYSKTQVGAGAKPPQNCNGDSVAVGSAAGKGDAADCDTISLTLGGRSYVKKKLPREVLECIRTLIASVAYSDTDDDRNDHLMNDTAAESMPVSPAQSAEAAAVKGEVRRDTIAVESSRMKGPRNEKPVATNGRPRSINTSGFSPQGAASSEGSNESLPYSDLAMQDVRTRVDSRSKKCHPTEKGQIRVGGFQATSKLTRSTKERAKDIADGGYQLGQKRGSISKTNEAVQTNNVKRDTKDLRKENERKIGKLQREDGSTGRYHSCKQCPSAGSEDLTASEAETVHQIAQPAMQRSMKQPQRIIGSREKLMDQLYSSLQRLSKNLHDQEAAEQLGTARKMYDKLKKDLSSRSKPNSHIQKQIQAFNGLLQKLSLRLLPEDDYSSDDA